MLHKMTELVLFEQRREGQERVSIWVSGRRVVQAELEPVQRSRGASVLGRSQETIRPGAEDTVGRVVGKLSGSGEDRSIPTLWELRSSAVNTPWLFRLSINSQVFSLVPSALFFLHHFKARLHFY